MGLPCDESGQLQWPQQYKVAVGQTLLADSETLDSLTIVSGEQVDEHGNKFYVVPQDIVRQLERHTPTGTESPTKRSSKRKHTKKK